MENIFLNKAIREIKLVGFFKELEYGLANGPSLKECISSEPLENKTKVLEYLKTGNMFGASPGIAYDVFSDEQKVSGLPSLLTDGVWIWLGELAYYVEKYNATLPKEMLQYMESKNWQVPLLSEEELNEITDQFLQQGEENSQQVSSGNFSE